MALLMCSGTSALVGSPGKLWDLLQDAAKLAPVDGNTMGSYTTLKSNSGILFAASEPMTPACLNDSDDRLDLLWFRYGLL